MTACTQLILRHETFAYKYVYVKTEVLSYERESWNRKDPLLMPAIALYINGT